MMPLLVKSVLDHQWINVYRDETVLNFSHTRESSGSFPEQLPLGKADSMSA